MAEFIHSREAEIEGPFLIDRTQLEALDTILRDERNRFKERLKQLLAQAVEKRVKSEKPHKKEETDEQLRKRIRDEIEQLEDMHERQECSVFFTDGSTAKVTDFSTALTIACPQSQTSELRK